MLSIYYGTKLSPYVHSDTYVITSIEDNLKFGFMKNLYKEEIPSLIEQLKRRCSYLFYKSYHVIDREIYICEVRNVEILDVNHKVKLLDKEGIVTDRTYDATKDIMYYYTNIVMKTVESEEVNHELEENTLKAIGDLEEIYIKYFSENKVKLEKNEEKKSLFKRLFG